MPLIITVSADEGLARVAQTFGRMPEAVDRAKKRALRKVGTWLKRQVLRAASSASAIPQKWFSQAMRYRVTASPEGLRVWIGTDPVKTHRLGRVRWTPRMAGARVGKRSFPGSWSWGRGKTGPAVMSRLGGSRLPIDVEKVEIHPAILARLESLQTEAAERFETLLRQELNYALTVEGAR